MMYECDNDKAASNIANHGISFNEAATCLLDDMALVREDCDCATEQRWVLLGMSSQGRLLVVVYTMRGDMPRLISARKATAKERKSYEA